jgi:hypothetical protein
VKYKRDTWSIDLPEGWVVEETDECTALYKPDGVGAFQISTFYKEAEVTKKDLLEFSEVDKPEEAGLAYLEGIKHTSEDGDDTFFNWWLRDGSELFFVTYVCAKGDELKEAKERQHIINSLQQLKP